MLLVKYKLPHNYGSWKFLRKTLAIVLFDKKHVLVWKMEGGYGGHVKVSCKIYIYSLFFNLCKTS